MFDIYSRSKPRWFEGSKRKSRKKVAAKRMIFGSPAPSPKNCKYNSKEFHVGNIPPNDVTG